jgi:hypothetical protein
VYRKGARVVELRAEADPKDTATLRKLLLDAVRRDRKRDDQIGEYQMEIRLAGDTRLMTTFVAAAD